MSSRYDRSVLAFLVHHTIHSPLGELGHAVHSSGPLAQVFFYFYYTIATQVVIHVLCSFTFTFTYTIATRVIRVTDSMCSFTFTYTQ